MSDGDTVALLKTVIDDETATVNCTSLPKYLLPFMNDSKIIFVHKPVKHNASTILQISFYNSPPLLLPVVFSYRNKFQK